MNQAERQVLVCNFLFPRGGVVKDEQDSSACCGWL